MTSETFTNIVVGYDDTEASMRALDRAADLAQACGAKLSVVSVAPVLVGRGVGPVDPSDTPDDRREDLAHAQERSAARGVEAEYLVAMGEPANEIVELAEMRGADLIVVGTREPGLLKRLLGLSVSGAVGRKAHCDVLVVH